VRVAGFEQTGELRVTGLVETFVGLGEQSSRPVESVVLAAPVPHRLVLHTTPALVVESLMVV